MATGPLRAAGETFVTVRRAGEDVGGEGALR